jgi:hypothetical protein
MYDAEAFSKKSHIVKHWMRSHPDLDVAPQLKIKILEQFKDCLSRQVGEAIAILLSQDTARKKRLLEEEAEEKLQEEKIRVFKEKKRPTKRKTEEVPAGWINPKIKFLTMANQPLGARHPINKPHTRVTLLVRGERHPKN